MFGFEGTEVAMLSTFNAGRTQLHLEASYGNVDGVERLLAAGVAVDAVDNEGLSLRTVEIVHQKLRNCFLFSAVVVLQNFG